eukprot:1463855-Rhodomonas_salina.1
MVEGSDSKKGATTVLTARPYAMCGTETADHVCVFGSSTVLLTLKRVSQLLTLRKHGVATTVSESRRGT